MGGGGGQTVPDIKSREGETKSGRERRGKMWGEEEERKEREGKREEKGGKKKGKEKGRKKRKEKRKRKGKRERRGKVGDKHCFNHVYRNINITNDINFG